MGMVLLENTEVSWGPLQHIDNSPLHTPCSQRPWNTPMVMCRSTVFLLSFLFFFLIFSIMVLTKMEELTIEVLRNTMRTFILSAYMSPCTLALGTLSLPFWNIRRRARIWSSQTGWLVKQALFTYIHIVVLIDFSSMSQVTHQVMV